MKKILSLVMILGAAVVANGQGYFTPSTANSDIAFGAHTGGTVFDASSGGIKCFSTGYNAQYYEGPAGTTDPNALTAVGVAAGFLGSSSASASAGYYNGDGNDIVISGTPGGSTVVIQLRAWKTGAGVTGFANALVKGTSQLMNIVLASSPNSGTPVTQMANFSINSAPEPATIALGLMGAGALFIRRRKV